MCWKMCVSEIMRVIRDGYNIITYIFEPSSKSPGIPPLFFDLNDVFCDFDCTTFPCDIGLFA